MKDEDAVARGSSPRSISVQLEQAVALFRLWSEHAPGAFWILHPGTLEVEFLSSKAEAIWGRPCHELTGPRGRWLEAVHAEDRSKLARVRSARHRRVDLSYRIVRPNGTTRWLHERAFPLLPDGSRIGGVSIDVTQRVQTSEVVAAQREAVAKSSRLSALGQLAATAVHELGQPLTAISTYTGSGLRLLATGIVQPNEIETLLERAHRESVRAASIIQELRQSLQRGAPRRSIVDVNDLIRQTVELTRRPTVKSRVSLRLELDPHVQPVAADPVQIQQVLVNLIQNAFDACEESSEGDPTILIESRRPHPGAVEVKVADTGRGFDPEDFDTLCEPLRTSKAEGWGLGLPICRAIVESHGGRIWATRVADWGAGVCFLLPTQS